MKARIVDPSALRAVTPAALAAYARGEGWTRMERFGAHSDVYALQGRELIIPGTDALGDYADVVASILSTLSRVEDRDELQVYRDLVGADRDVVRVRAPEAEDDGSVRVDVGVEIVSRARDLLLSAACAAKEPRASYRAGKVKDASDYMERVRLGQTEQGSFVVTLLAPVPPALAPSGQAALWPIPEDEPYERLVTRRLVDGLQAARLAAEGAIRGDGLNAFEKAIPEGVSANLCEALATLIERGEGLEVSVTWARTRPTPEARRRVEFSRTVGEVFREAAREFRSREPRPEERLLAFVVDLSRQPREKVGRVTLRAFIDGQLASVRTEMSGDMYSQAVTAHEQKRSVTVTGDLKRHGQRWRLENPRELRLEPTEPEETDIAPDGENGMFS